MEHTHIVQADDLQKYADTRASEEVIPELLYLLVKQSSIPSICRIPYGDNVNLPGWDGIVETEEAFLEFVPMGRSYWEIGTGKNPQDKATCEFRKRMDTLSDGDRTKASFVFVTPRTREWSEPKQTEWLRKRADSGWKDIRIIDGVKLADWIREFPALGQWTAKKIGLSPSLGGLSTPAEHWENIRATTASGDPPLPAKLFIEGRSNACNALQKLFEGTSKQLLLFAESRSDVADFVAAYIETLDRETGRNYAYRCLYVSEEDAWRAVVETRKSHVLVAEPKLGLETPERADLQTLAVRKEHAVIVPLCGAWAEKSHEIIRLRSPSQSEIESILREAGYSEVRAGELAGVGGIPAIRRNLQGLGALPPYATWGAASMIAQAGLVGKWEGGNAADKAALEQLLGKEYGEWIETLRHETLRSDSPLIQLDEKWRFVARGEAWGALGNRITDDDLDRFQEAAVAVLGERDPMFDLPKEKRIAAGLRGKQLRHSPSIREGLAETLALIGSRPEPLSSCSQHKAEKTAILTIRRLLDNADWDVWASLGSLLPLLAEAAPDEFLSAVEFGLKDLDHSPFRDLFAQEGSGVEGWNHMSGLLWALETLAWNPDLLSRVALILSDLAEIDPGGSWANRPFNSLVDIFLPWHVQTCASFDKRKAAVETVLQEHPKVGWELVLSLLPHEHGFTIGSRRPTWRNYIPRDWKDRILKSEYWEQITIYTGMAVGLAKTSTEKLGQLIDRLADLPEPAYDSIMEHLASEEIVNLAEERRVVIWEKLDGLAREHRKFADADWALPEKSVEKMEIAANKLIPGSPEFRYRYLFSDSDFDLYDEKGDHESQRNRLDKARQFAVQAILGTGNLRTALTFARNVAAPFQVGRALGGLGNEELETEILSSLLNTGDETDERVVSGFVFERFRKLGWSWVDQALANKWDDIQKCVFLTLLPFEDEVWNRVEYHLCDEEQTRYWQTVSVNPYGEDRDLTLAIKKLIEFGRAPEAVLCVYRTIQDEGRFREELALRALHAVLDNSDVADRIDSYHTVEVIKRLQESSSADTDALFRIEWCFLSLLGPFSSGSPVTLERRLASDPAFFGEVIALVFRGEHEDDNEARLESETEHLAMNAYKLLNDWKICPGKLADGSFDAGAFTEWMEEAMRITNESGHGEVAQGQIGQVLTYAPSDPGCLWIHKAVARALNARDAEKMRSGFTIKLFNRRGAYWSTGGTEERGLAEKYRQKADALEENHYTRFATEMRRFATSYDREAEREARPED